MDLGETRPPNMRSLGSEAQMDTSPGARKAVNMGRGWAVKGVLIVRQDPFGAASPEADLRRGAGQRLAERRTEGPSP